MLTQKQEYKIKKITKDQTILNKEVDLLLTSLIPNTVIENYINSENPIEFDSYGDVITKVDGSKIYVQGFEDEYIIDVYKTQQLNEVQMDFKIEIAKKFCEIIRENENG